MYDNNLQTTINCLQSSKFYIVSLSIIVKLGQFLDYKFDQPVYIDTTAIISFTTTMPILKYKIILSNMSLRITI